MSSYQEQAAVQDRKLDAQDLYTFVDRFIANNKNSPHVERRWLAAYAGDLKTMAFHVKYNHRDMIKKQVDEFRLRELEGERKKLQAEFSSLETEESKLLREIKQLSAKSPDA